MDAPRCIAVTGLGTFLGREILERVRHAHSGISLVGIGLQRPYFLDAEVAHHSVDLTEPTANQRLAEVFEKEGVEAVLHTAFRREPTPDLEGDHELEAIGSLHLLDACAATGVRRLVVASTTMVYGPWPDNPNFLTEDHPLRGHPQAHCVNNRVQVEQMLADWRFHHPGIEVSVLRPCWMMGPRHRDAVVRYFDRPVVPTVMGYDPLIQFVHEEDCLRAFEVALLAGRPGVYNLTGRGVLPLSAYLRSAGKRAVPVPAPLLYRLRSYPSQVETGDRPEGFYDYLRYLWVAAGERGFAAFGEPVYTSQEAWASLVSSRRMRRYR